MKRISLHAYVVLSLSVVLYAGQAFGQIVINELVKEQRDANNDGASVNPDATEFVELYNAGASAVDLTGWTLGTINLTSGTPEFSDTIPSGSIAPGGYFVIGGASVPNVNYTPIAGEIWTDVAPRIMELKNPSATLVDAVGYDVWRTGLTRLSNATPAQLAEIGSGYQGELFSMSLGPAAPTYTSWSRYRDGRDTNKNGLDFGLIPPTPGASNNLPLNASHTVPNVDGLNVGDSLSSQYQASFVLPRVIDPTVVTAGLNPRAIPASPQGGKAIVAWDNTGGGNAVNSKELVNSFNLYAYFDTTPIGVAPTTHDQEWETSIYGIGSTDPFFRDPDPTNGIGQVPGSSVVTRNSSTGIGWVYQQFEDGSAVPTPGFSKLMLVDFGDGGDSELAGEWQIKQTIDMSTVATNWYKLGLSYNPANHQVTGTFNNQQFTFPVDYDLLGTFFVGYREGITAEQTRFDKLNPPIYDLFVAGVPGDFNNDSKVDAADYVTWRKNSANSSLPNDNGLTTQAARYSLWRASFGNPGSGSGSLDVGAVPEPGTIGLALIGVFAVFARRRRS